MATRAWFRLDCEFDTAEWLDECSGMARYAWVMLLAYTKRSGIRGRVGVISTRVFARRIDALPEAIEEMLAAGVRDGALQIIDGDWVVTSWDKYQNPITVRVQRHREKKATV